MISRPLVNPRDDNPNFSNSEIREAIHDLQICTRVPLVQSIPYGSRLLVISATNNILSFSHRFSFLRRRDALYKASRRSRLLHERSESIFASVNSVVDNDRRFRHFTSLAATFRTSVSSATPGRVRRESPGRLAIKLNTRMLSRFVTLESSTVVFDSIFRLDGSRYIALNDTRVTITVTPQSQRFQSRLRCYLLSLVSRLRRKYLTLTSAFRGFIRSFGPSNKHACVQRATAM